MREACDTCLGTPLLNPKILRGMGIVLTDFKRFAESSLNPSGVEDKESLRFCRVVLALCVAAESNYESLRDNYDKDNLVNFEHRATELEILAARVLLGKTSKPRGGTSRIAGRLIWSACAFLDGEVYIAE